MFAYCANNPVNLSDSTGYYADALPLNPWGEFLKTAASVLGTLATSINPVVLFGVVLLSTVIFSKPVVLGDGTLTAAERKSKSDTDNEVDVEVVIPRSRYPETAQHVEDAIENGHPDTLTVDRSKAKTNRRKSLKAIPKVKNKDLDEYPPAMFKEGGTGASVRPISSSDNRGAGSWMGHKLRAFPDGTRVRIRVGD